MDLKSDSPSEMDDFTLDDNPAGDPFGLRFSSNPLLPSLPYGSSNMQLNYKANLVGEKILNPAIHLCDLCNMPIIIYGRMVRIDSFNVYLFCLHFLELAYCTTRSRANTSFASIAPIKRQIVPCVLVVTTSFSKLKNATWAPCSCAGQSRANALISVNVILKLT